MPETDLTTKEPSALEGEVFSHSDTARKVAEYSRRYTIAKLRERANAHHRKVTSNQTKLVSVASRMLHEAYLTGCVLNALRAKAKGDFLTKDGARVEGTELAKSTAYRYMELCDSWHLLANAGGVLSITGALKHAKSEREMKTMSDLEDPEEWPEEGEEGDIIDAPAKKTGRPPATLARKLPRRFSLLAADITQGMYDDPQGVLTAVTLGIDSLEAVREQIQGYIDEN